MEQHRLCYISRNYYNLTSAGNKAKTDNEDTLMEMGAVNLGFIARFTTARYWPSSSTWQASSELASC